MRRSDARFETSAAWAEAEASNTKLSTQVEQNAHQMHEAAEDAAVKAQVSSQYTIAFHVECQLIPIVNRINPPPPRSTI